MLVRVKFMFQNREHLCIRRVVPSRLNVIGMLKPSEFNDEEDEHNEEETVAYCTEIEGSSFILTNENDIFLV
ncbi:unnamed protein product [Colias eurytheme]|nr:unnamed protein product [Colias eurytheme]